MRYFTTAENADRSNRKALAPPPSDTIDARILAANTAERHTIPSGARYVGFSATGDFFALFGGSSVTAAVPSTDVTDGTASELNPAVREIPSGVTHVSLIASATTTVTLAFYG